MKAHIEEVLRRYSYIQTALKEGKTEVNFYVGKRKQKIVIDATLKIILAIIEDITKKEKDIIHNNFSPPYTIFNFGG